MKKTAAIISACALTFALSACSGNNYVMPELVHWQKKE